MSQDRNRITLPSPHGDVVGQRVLDGSGNQVWEFALPEGDERFYGSRPEALRTMKSLILDYAQADGLDEDHLGRPLKATLRGHDGYAI